MPWTPPRDWSDGDQVTQAALNTDVRDNMEWLHGRLATKPFVIFLPQSRQFEQNDDAWALPASRNGHPVLEFEDEFLQYAIFSSVLSNEYAGGGLVVDLYWLARTATGGSVVWGIAFESHTPDVDDLDSESMGTQTTVVASPSSTPGVTTKTVVTFTDGAAIDSLAAGESFRLRIERLADTDGRDDMVGFAQLFRVVVREG